MHNYKIGNIVYDTYEKSYGIVSDVYDQIVYVRYYKDLDTLETTCEEYSYDFGDEEFNYGKDFDIEFFADSISSAFPEYVNRHKQKYVGEHSSKKTYTEDEVVCPNCKLNFDKDEFYNITDYEHKGYNSMYYKNGIFTCPICNAKMKISKYITTTFSAELI